MFDWIKRIKQKRATKRFIQTFVDNNLDSVILKKWEHKSWGDAIYVNEKGFYGHLSGLRQHLSGFNMNFHCDLRDRDVIVMDVSSVTSPLREGKKYEIGLFTNAKIMRDPSDMFFASYVRLGFADDYNLSTIIELAKQKIKSL